MFRERQKFGNRLMDWAVHFRERFSEISLPVLPLVPARVLANLPDIIVGHRTEYSDSAVPFSLQRAGQLTDVEQRHSAGGLPCRSSRASEYWPGGPPRALRAAWEPEAKQGQPSKRLW